MISDGIFQRPRRDVLGMLGYGGAKILGKSDKECCEERYTRFVEPCAGTFAMSNLAIQNGYKPEQIETSDVSMMSSVMGYAITGKPLDELEIHAQGFSNEELLDPAVALYAQMYLRTSKTAGNEYFFNLLKDLRDRREEHIGAYPAEPGEHQEGNVRHDVPSVGYVGPSGRGA